MTSVSSPPASGPVLGRGRRRSSDLPFASVLHVNEKGGSFGGTEEYIALITSALAARGVRSHLVCGVVLGSLPPKLESVCVVEGLASRRAATWHRRGADGGGRRPRPRCHLRAQRLRSSRDVGPRRDQGSGDADVVRARPLRDVCQRAALASGRRQLHVPARPRLPGRHQRRALCPSVSRPTTGRGRRRATHGLEPVARGSRRDHRRQRLHARPPP